RCGISEWFGAPLAVALHHVNGNRMDNRIENLELLCANCHSQTDTYGGRNGHRKPDRHLKLVEPPEDEKVRESA
ncbi:MAG: HNH endonuclease signature motif containing protein, partial [Solirubrobacterales bacterium]